MVVTDSGTAAMAVSSNASGTITPVAADHEEGLRGHGSSDPLATTGRPTVPDRSPSGQAVRKAGCLSQFDLSGSEIVVLGRLTDPMVFCGWIRLHPTVMTVGLAGHVGLVDRPGRRPVAGVGLQG